MTKTELRMLQMLLAKFSMNVKNEKIGAGHQLLLESCDDIKEALAEELENRGWTRQGKPSSDD